MEKRNAGLWGRLNGVTKGIIIVVPLLAVFWIAASNGLIPGFRSEKSKNVERADISKDAVNEKTGSTTMLTPPRVDDMEYADVESRPEIRLMNWVWFGNAGIFSANGGNTTMKGTLMDQYGLNLKMITNNSVADMKREQLSFIAAYAGGNKNPSQGVHFVTIMGDGATAYIPSMNQQIVKAYGPEYKLKVFGIVGFSMGEDCIMGPQEWKENPQLMKGAVISAVIGDGDWGLGVRFGGGDNGLKINPDPDTYDPDAMNFYPAPDDDFLKAAEDAISGRLVKLKLKDKNGKLTGKEVEKPIQAAATWFPGDRNVALKTNLVRVISTKEYPNQMATVIVGCDKWLKENSKSIVSFLSAALTASNQIKQYDEWFKYATQLAPKVFCASANDCSETSDDWYSYAKPGGALLKDAQNTVYKNSDGNTTLVGGTQMANLADNKKYFGLRGGNNYYKTVFEYFNGVLKDLNPYGFMDNVGEVTPYEEAIDLTYLKQVNIDAGQTTKVDYSKNSGQAFAERSWKIVFASGSARITPEGETELEKLFTAVNIAENARVEIVGHTDNVGEEEKNITLSLDRAKAVKQWLLSRSSNSFPSERFSVDGKGENVPVASNDTEAGRKQNRRVQITLLQ